jgi:hypothetical protein
MLNASATDVEYLTVLVYELLDAHEDTARLRAREPFELRWDAHIDYLSGLQRVGREALARLTASAA